MSVQLDRNFVKSLENIDLTDSRNLVFPSGFRPQSDIDAVLADRLTFFTGLTKARRNDGEFVPFGSSRWRQFNGGKPYRHIRERNLMFIEHDDIAIAGHKSMQLRFNDEVRHSGFVNYRLPRLRANSAFHRKTQPKQSRLRFAEQLLVERLKRFSLGVEAQRVSPHLDAWGKINLQRLKCGLIFGHRCFFGRRFHHNFTSISKAVRCSLRGRSGEPLYEIDISQSQPHLLFSLLRRTNPNTQKKGGRKGAGETTSYVSQFTGNKMPLEALLSSCERCEFYEMLMDETGLCRDCVKRQVMIWLNCERRMAPHVSIFGVMENINPDVNKSVMDWKLGNHKHVGAGLQRIESAIVIDGVAMDFIRMCPGIEIMTIHDGVIVPQSKVGLVRGLMEKHFKNFDTTPHLTIQPISEDFERSLSKLKTRNQRTCTCNSQVDDLPRFCPSQHLTPNDE